MNNNKNTIDNKSFEIVSEIFKAYGLTDKEISTYIKCFGTGKLSLNEISKLTEISEKELQEISGNLVFKGFFKSILIENSQGYEALYPYPWIASTYQEFNDSLSNMGSKFNEGLDDVLKQFKENKEDTSEIDDFIDELDGLNSDFEIKVTEESMAFGDRLEEVLKNNSAEIQKDFNKQVRTILKNSFEALEEKSISEINFLDEDFKKKFESTKEKANLAVKNTDELTSKIDNLQNKISTSLKKLRLGITEKTVILIIKTAIENEIEEIKKAIQQDFVRVFNDPIKRMYNNIYKSVKKELEEPISDNISKMYSKNTDKRNADNAVINSIMTGFSNISSDSSNMFSKTTSFLQKLADEQKNLGRMNGSETKNEIVELFNQNLKEISEKTENSVLILIYLGNLAKLLNKK